MPEWMNQKFHRYLADQRKGKLSGDHRMACDLPEMAVRTQHIQSEAVSTHNREFLLEEMISAQLAFSLAARERWNF